MLYLKLRTNSNCPLTKATSPLNALKVQILMS